MLIDHGTGLPTVPVSGDNASLEVVRTIARPSAPLKLLIVGGTCATGFALAREALARGHRVTVIGRGTDHDEELRDAQLINDDPMATPPEDVVAGHDAVVSAVTGQCDGDPRMIFPLAARLVQVAQDTHVPRLLWAGASGDVLRAAATPTARTTGGTPEQNAETLAQGLAFEVLRLANTPVRWSYFSPPTDMADGGDPSRYRVAVADWPPPDEEGHGRIALIDYARAAIDELEHPQFDGRRFTIAAF
jgi:putative NADH-flavin reductase